MLVDASSPYTKAVTSSFRIQVIKAMKNEPQDDTWKKLAYPIDLQNQTTPSPYPKKKEKKKNYQTMEMNTI